MADAADFAKMVPGFDFLQNLVKNAGAVLPAVGQWVAPTLDPEEIEKRIEELRTVQFWLEQNARMLAATIQALEVQRMTLSTLKTMNVQMGDLRESLKIHVPVTPAKPTPATELEPADPEPKPAAKAARKTAKAGQAKPQPTSAVDPMQWWGALTKQFTELAASAMKDTSTGAAKSLTGAMVKQGSDAPGNAPKKAESVPAKVARKAATPRKRAEGA